MTQNVQGNPQCDKGALSGRQNSARFNNFFNNLHLFSRYYCIIQIIPLYLCIIINETIKN